MNIYVYDVSNDKTKVIPIDKDLASKWGTICTLLPMFAPNGKMRKSLAANAANACY